MKRWYLYALIALLAACCWWLWMERGQRKEAERSWRQSDAVADSLIRLIEHQRQVEDVRLARGLDSLRHHHDSLITALLTRSKDAYIRHHEAARALPLPDKWRYMGVVAVELDTASDRHAGSMVRSEADH